jgi:hypothetical protein
MEMGTEILLARMKDHPEEFINSNVLDYSVLRWEAVLHESRNHLPKEDIDAIDAGIKQLYVDRFNERVLKTLAGESEPEQTEGTLTYKTQGRYTIGMTNAATVPRNIFGSAPVKAEGCQIGQAVDAHEEYRKHMLQQQRLMNSAQNTLGQGESPLKNFFKRGT